MKYRQNCKSKKILLILLLFVMGNCMAAYARSETIVVTEEMANSVGFYDTVNGKEYGDIKVGNLPHELAISDDQKTAYVTNFGLHDYGYKPEGSDEASISVIDIPNHVEKYRLFTFDPNKKENFSKVNRGLHGIRLRPSHPNQLYTNAVNGDKMVVFDINTKKIIHQFSINTHTYNFVFSPDGEKLWLMLGDDGVARIDADTGTVTGSYKMATSVHGVDFTPDGQQVVLSGFDEVELLNPATVSLYKKFDHLGVGQILHATVSPDMKYLWIPATYNELVLVVDIKTGKTIKNIPVTLDPLYIQFSSTGKEAYVTGPRTDKVTKIHLNDYRTEEFYTQDGPNDLRLTPSFPEKTHKTFVLGVPLSLSGNQGVDGRQMALGYEYWATQVRRAGGLFVGGAPYDVKIIYIDTKSNNSLVAEKTQTLIQKYKVNALLGTNEKDAYRIEKSVAKNNHVLFVPLSSLEKAWNPNDSLATGLDYFITSKIFSEKYEAYYNLKPTELSAKAVAASIVLQQALLATDNFDYDQLTQLFEKNEFHTFLQ